MPHNHYLNTVYALLVSKCVTHNPMAFVLLMAFLSHTYTHARAVSRTETVQNMDAN